VQASVAPLPNAKPIRTRGYAQRSAHERHPRSKNQTIRRRRLPRQHRVLRDAWRSTFLAAAHPWRPTEYLAYAWQCQKGLLLHSGLRNTHPLHRRFERRDNAPAWRQHTAQRHLVFRRASTMKGHPPPHSRRRVAETYPCHSHWLALVDSSHAPPCECLAHRQTPVRTGRAWTYRPSHSMRC